MKPLGTADQFRLSIYERLDHDARFRNSYRDEWPAGFMSPDVDADEKCVMSHVEACHQRLANIEAPDHAQTLLLDGVEFAAPVLALERSSQDHKATCISWIMKNRGVSIRCAEQIVDTILETNGLAFPTETIAIYLREQETPLYNSRSSSPDELVVDYQLAQGEYIVIDVGLDEPTIETLSKITDCLKARNSSHVWRPLLDTVTSCVALGGLSGSGRSTMCRMLVQHIGEAATWLKISYLCDLASMRLGKSIYGFPVPVWAMEVVHELDNYARRHPWTKVIALDSLHHEHFAHRLAELIGNTPFYRDSNEPPSQAVPYSRFVKLLVVYVDTPLHLRILRSRVKGARSVRRKDSVTRSRLAYMMEEFADLVVGNEGNAEVTFEQIWKVATRYGRENWSKTGSCIASADSLDERCNS